MFSFKDRQEYVKRDGLRRTFACGKPYASFTSLLFSVVFIANGEHNLLLVPFLYRLASTLVLTAIRTCVKIGKDTIGLRLVLYMLVFVYLFF